MASWFEVEPPEIQLDAFCFDTNFHPSSQVLAVALINGNVQSYRLSQEESALASTVQAHSDSCRRLRFLTDTQVISVGSDHAVALSDFASSTVALRIENAHESSVNSVLPIAGLVLTGDDDGVVKAWDLRDPSAFKFHFVRHREQISNMALVGDFSLYTSSIEGVITEFDLRLPGFVNQSEGLDEEIQDFTVQGDSHHLVAGTGGGDLVVFQRDTLEAVDRLRGHPGSVDTLAKAGEWHFVTGCVDGYVRLVGLSPLSIIGPICEEEQREYNSDETFSIEKVEVSPDGLLLSSVSHEHMVKFWDIREVDRTSRPLQNTFFEEFKEE